MDIHWIPFEGKFIVYRPLKRLAFVANAALLRRIEQRLAGQFPAPAESDAFLEQIGFWEPDPAPPELWCPGSQGHRPTTATLLLTSACNLRCTYCYARGGEDTSYRMSWPLAQRVIDTAYENARAFGRDEFGLALHGGGEPTLNWEVLEAAVRYARAKDMPCHISMASNGVWSQRQQHFILDHFDGLSISFDGIREVQDTQRPRASGRGSFSAVLRTIRALDGSRLRYGVRLTATPATFERLAEGIALLCSRTDCQVMQVEPAYSGQRGIYADPTPEQGAAFVNGFMGAFEIAMRHERTLFYSGARPWVIASAFCRAPEEALVVTPEGDVVTCFETHDRRHSATASFTIGEATPEAVRIAPNRVAAFAVAQEERRSGCRSCFCYWHCGGDCASRCTATAESRRGRCDVNRAISREIIAWYIAAGGGVWRGAPDDQAQALLPGPSD